VAVLTDRWLGDKKRLDRVCVPQVNRHFTPIRPAMSVLRKSSSPGIPFCARYPR
jgi:hypothetical protein